MWIFAGLPQIKVHEVRSLDNIPSIDITFPDGKKDSLILQRFYPSEQSRLEREFGCNYFGYLKNDKSACVAVTGCAGQDNLEFTINANYGGSSNMYILHKDSGRVELIENPFTVFLSSYFTLKGLWKLCFFSNRRAKRFQSTWKLQQSEGVMKKISILSMEMIWSMMTN